MNIKEILAFAPSSEQGKNSFRVVTNRRGGTTYLEVYDDIGRDPTTGEGVDAKDVSRVLRSAGPVEVSINSAGGSFFDGASIYAALKQHRQPVTVEVVGLAFSAASLIAVAGDRVKMSPASSFGIHRSATVASGNVDAIKDAQNWLEKIDGILVEAYRDKTGHSEEQIREWLIGDNRDGSLWNAEEAVELGFADEITGQSKAKPKAVAKRQEPQRDPDAGMIFKQDRSTRSRLAACELRLLTAGKRSF